MKVLFLWEVPQKLQDYMKNRVDEKIECVFPPFGETEDLIPLAEDAEVMVGWRPAPELLQAAPCVRLFQNPGVGVQHLLPLFEGFPDILIANSHGNTYFTAQHAVALLLSLTNRVILHHNYMAEGIWRTGDDEGASIPLRNRVIGLLGFGAIGKRVASFLSGWEVELTACKRKISGEKPEILKSWYDIGDLNVFLKECDILVISLPHTPETGGLIGKKEIELLGPEGLLINVGRGPVIREEDLYTALKEKSLGGAGIDVWYNYEPESNEDGKKYPFNFPFQELDNVILSPHRAASPFSDLERWGEVIENINRVSRGEKPLNLVNRKLGY